MIATTLCMSLCVREGSFNGSYIYSVEGDSTAAFQPTDPSIAQNTKQEKKKG